MNTENEKTVRAPFFDAFEKWTEKRGVWPRLTHDEIFAAGWQAALQSQVSNTDGWVRELLTLLVRNDELLRMALLQLNAWQEKYGDANPAWLPPAGDVPVMEAIANIRAINKATLSAAPKAPQQVSNTPQEWSGEFCTMCKGETGWEQQNFHGERELEPSWIDCPRCKGTGEEPATPQQQEQSGEAVTPEDRLMDEARKYWKHANQKHRGAVQWISSGDDGALLIFTRGEYRDKLMHTVWEIENSTSPATPTATASHCMCDACKQGVIHASDCAVHNVPAEPKGPCDCGATTSQDMRKEFEKKERGREDWLYSDTGSNVFDINSDGSYMNPDRQSRWKIWCSERGILTESQESAPGQEAVAWVEVKDTRGGPYDFHGKELLPKGKHNLYLAPPTSTAIAAMVIKQAVEMLRRLESAFVDIAEVAVGNRAIIPKCERAVGRIHGYLASLTPANAEAELEALMMKVADEVQKATIKAGVFSTAPTPDERRAIVRRVLDEKGE